MCRILLEFALNHRIVQLNSDIQGGRPRQHEVDEANVQLDEGARRAKEEAQDEVQAQAENLREMEDRLEQEISKNTAVSAQIDALNKKVAKAKARQEEADAEAKRIKTESELKIHVETVELENLADRRESENEQNDTLNVRIIELNKQILSAKCRQEVLDTEAIQAKESVGIEINANTEDPIEMEGRLTSPAAQNGALKDKIGKLKAEIEERRDEQLALDDASILLAEEARVAREEAEEQIKAQVEALKSLQAQMDAKASQSSVPKDEISDPKRIVSNNR